MRKYIISILTIITFLIIPNNINAEVRTITQEDFDNAKEEAVWVDGEDVGYYEEGHVVNGLYYWESPGDGACIRFENGEYKLGSNVTIGSDDFIFSGLLIEEDDEVVIDLNGYSITFGEKNFFPMLVIGDLTIKGNGSIIGNDFSDGFEPFQMFGKISALVIDGGNLVIENGTYNGTVLAADNSTVTISNGTFVDNFISLVASPLFGNNSVNKIDIKGGTFRGNEIGLLVYEVDNVVIKGGIFEGNKVGLDIEEFSSISLSGGTFKCGNDGYGAIATGYDVSETNFKTVLNGFLVNSYTFDNEIEYHQAEDSKYGVITYTQKELSVVRGGEKTLITQEDFDEAKANGSTDKGISYGGNGYTLDTGNYKLGSNINIDDPIFIYDSEDVLFDLNNKIIESEEYVFCVLGKLTISGDGEVIAGEVDDSPIGQSNKKITIVCGSFDDSVAQLVINGGTYKGIVLVCEDGNVVINGGNFVDTSAPLVALTLQSSSANSIIINDGYFEGTSAGSFLENVRFIEINGGVFKGETSGLMIMDSGSGEDLVFAGGKFIATGENSYGGITICAGEFDEENFYRIANNLLEKNYMYYESLEYNHTVDELYGFVAYSQKEISVIPENGEYEIIEGDNQKYKKGDLVIKSNGDFDLFTGLLVDGNEVNESNYTVKSGSTIVTLKSDYLKTIPDGSHTVTFVYANGSVSTTFNKVANNNPETLDNIYYYIMMLISSIIMLFVNKKVIKKI